jgi:hypothetical protein
MKKIILFVSVLMGWVSAYAAEEKTDVTNQYVVNASFEADNLSALPVVNNGNDGLRGYTVAAPQGWTVNNSANAVSLLVTKDCFTDNNFGKVTTLADGDKAYYLRMGWSGGTTTVRQTIPSLTKGKYQLAASVRSAYTNTATSSFDLVAGSAKSSNAFSQGSEGCIPSMEWAVLTVDFELVADGSAAIGFDVSWVSGGSCIMFDNVRLYRLSDDYVAPEEPTEQDIESPTEGSVFGDFIAESQMQSDLLQMLANFATYMNNDFQEAQAPNSVGEPCGCFKGENTMANDERGVRPNADLSMICAFLVKYGKGKVTLPAGISWGRIEELAMKSLVFAYSTHKANKLKVCSGGNYWGSTSTSDAVWESSLWAMSVAYSAFFQWDKLSDAQKGYVEKLLKAECNYELYRSIPTGYAGDTKAEENGWEADVLAVTLGLFPNDPLAPKWFARLREFAINSYSQKDDATNTTVIDPEYDNKTVKDLYKGQNLYDDYTLQNHNYFHTSYQNVVIQELGEAALALKLFQQGLYGEEKWKTNALMHNNDKVMQEVLYWLALADGELAMPNGNDWSLFLYDQITSYSTNACFLRDPHALMLENLAYKMIKARQTTTTDGSWLLRADVGARRMGVEAHRVMMTWLMHEVLSTASLTPTSWTDFNRSYSQAKHFASQNIVRAATDSRFTCFSWSQGLQSYTGYIAANSVDKNKIIVPFRANNTGNFLGWYSVQGKNTNATPVVSGIYQLEGNAYTMNGELNTNDATLNNRFAIYSTPGNAVIYLDYVRANQNATITAEKGGLMAISVDELTKTKRTFYYSDNSLENDSYTHQQLDGSKFATLPGPWVNVDNALSIVNVSGKSFAFGEKANNNSVNTAKLYGSYNDKSRTVKANDVVDRRAIAYYSNMTAEETNSFFHQLLALSDNVPEGWNGVIVPDGGEGSTWYMLLSNFASDQKCTLQLQSIKPVFTVKTAFTENGASATFAAEENHSVMNTLKFFIDGKGLEAVQAEGNPDAIYLLNNVKGKNEIVVTAMDAGRQLSKEIELTNKVLKVSIQGGELQVEEAAGFPESAEENFTKGYKDITEENLVNASFEEDETYGKADGNATCDAGTFNPCYVNTVTAVNSKWPNILPVKGWTAGNGLSGGSNFCRMYSMPYSTTLYCVSPKAVGNYADRCSRPVFDENCGSRTLTVLNSWDSGANAITQDVALPEGKYRVLMDARYICTNETSNNGKVVTTGNNTNTSLTGIKIGSKTDYRYPSQPGTWQQLCYDFELTENQTVTLSLGFRTSAGVGAANNTLLYIDNVRLLVSEEATGIENLSSSAYRLPSATFDLQGRRVTTASMRRGVYIQNGKKFVVE